MICHNLFRAALSFLIKMVIIMILLCKLVRWNLINLINNLVGMVCKIVEMLDNCTAICFIPEQNLVQHYKKNVAYFNILKVYTWMS